jgi:glycosyltransferase involved in cell wall biosynthesis
MHPGVSAHIQVLSRLENVHFLGFRPYETIPQYLHFFTAGIIPFQKNELTSAVNPVKLYEYSAAGIPTVATNFSEDVSQLRDKIFVSDSREDFITSLPSAIKKSKDPSFAAQLQTFAREHDWETKTSLILQFIHQHLAAQHAS